MTRQKKPIAIFKEGKCAFLDSIGGRFAIWASSCGCCATNMYLTDQLKGEDILLYESTDCWNRFNKEASFVALNQDDGSVIISKGEG